MRQGCELTGRECGPSKLASMRSFDMKRPGIFIQTNDKQRIGAIVSAYSMKRNSKHAAEFDVTVMRVEDYPFFSAHDGESYCRHGVKRVWNNADLQSFTLTRFLPPQLMGYEGRSVVVDPDVFAIGDVWELLSRDMGSHAIICRQLPFKRQGYATSVMLLDNAKLKHWTVEQSFHDLFSGRRDYHDWISLIQHYSLQLLHYHSAQLAQNIQAIDQVIVHYISQSN